MSKRHSEDPKDLRDIGNVLIFLVAGILAFGAVIGAALAAWLL